MTALEVLSARRRALLARATTEALIGSVLALGDPEVGSDERLAFAWTCSELESRFPDVNPAIDAWLDGGEDGRTYGEVLVAALRDLGAAS